MINLQSQQDSNPDIDCDITPFVERENIIVVEVESVAAAAGWLREASVPGFSGDSYFRWNGANAFNTPGNGLTEYKIYINNPGTYHFRWRSKIMHGAEPTESNDTWLRIPDADDFFAKNGGSVKYPKGGMFVQSDVIVNGSSSGGWMKVYSSGTTQWTWSARTSDHDPHEIYATFNEPGEYTVQISGRSKNHAVDRFVLFKDSEYSVTQATTLSLQETLCQPREKEYYTISFVVNTNEVPLEGAEVTFNGTTITTNSSGEAIFMDVESVFTAPYSVSAYCHNTQSGSLEVNSDIRKTIALLLIDEPPCNGEPLPVRVTFNVTDGNEPIGDARVDFNENFVLTNSNGQAIFEAVVPAKDLIYTVQHDGFDLVTDTVDIDEDTDISVVLNRITGFNNSLKEGIKLYPNPVVEVLNITGLTGENTIRLISSDGRILISEETRKEDFSMNTEGLSAGLYILRIYGKNGDRFSVRVVVKNS